ncbi:MauE/DoxX family redox-associated membrane protein [Geomesophilobacter sediminis]|uniref:DoxX family membrane protein n=1 Tax=Geomesophilobacter sediminis TaxID=2798584 RepID=A0A8J7S8S7_9BACT|nr:MauE/DoxX family redox-associated membrane protein [Geomesophilobacter sediminis]MBJ6726606.1 DoxX family membrane protein [Geomesophilobacter sediminis]
MSGVKRYLPVVVRVALGAVFVYAGVTKIADPVGFAGSIAAYQVLPYFPSYLVAAVLPWVELFSGLLILSGYRVKAGALVIGALNLIFIAALASAAVRGLDIDCGCFKEGGAKVSPLLALLRDLVFLAMTAVVLTTGEKAPPEPGGSAGHPCDCTETSGNQM